MKRSESTNISKLMVMAKDLTDDVNKCFEDAKRLQSFKKAEEKKSPLNL